MKELRGCTRYSTTLRGMLVLLHISFISANRCESVLVPCGLMQFGNNPCLPIQGRNGETIRPIPKLVEYSRLPFTGTKRHFVCELSYCESNPCENGWCEEVLGGYQCHCLSGYKGTNCRKQLSAKIYVAEPDKGKLLAADLQDELVFTTIPASSSPRAVTTDAATEKIYWCDWYEGKVYRASLNGSNRETVLVTKEPQRLAIAEKARTLFISYTELDKITSMCIAEGSPIPGNESDFVTDIKNARSLIVDEEQGYLYWRMKNAIARTFLDGTGETEVLYYNETLLNTITEMSMDFNKCVRRIFIFSFGQQRTYYMDVSPSPNANTNIIHHELTQYVGDPESEDLVDDVFFFDGVLFWATLGSSKGIGMLRDYEHSNRSSDFQAVPQIDKRPDKLHIAYVEL